MTKSSKLVQVIFVILAVFSLSACDAFADFVTTNPNNFDRSGDYNPAGNAH